MRTFMSIKMLKCRRRWISRFFRFNGKIIKIQNSSWSQEKKRKIYGKHKLKIQKRMAKKMERILIVNKPNKWIQIPERGYRNLIGKIFYDNINNDKRNEINTKKRQQTTISRCPLQPLAIHVPILYESYNSISWYTIHHTMQHHLLLIECSVLNILLIIYYLVKMSILIKTACVCGFGMLSDAVLILPIARYILFHMQ